MKYNLMDILQIKKILDNIKLFFKSLSVRNVQLYKILIQTFKLSEYYLIILQHSIRKKDSNS